jgi:hypothetical protein
VPVVATLSHRVPPGVTALPPEPYWFECYGRSGSEPPRGHHLVGEGRDEH